MASLAVAGKGTFFRRWSGAAWVDIAEILSISGPGMSRDVIDVTSLDSVGGYREFIAGFRDPGTITLSMIFRRDTFNTMKTDFESDTLQNYEMVLSDAEVTSLEFEGLVTEVPLAVPADDKITMEVTIKISGEVTVNSGSGSAS